MSKFTHKIVNDDEVQEWMSEKFSNLGHRVDGIKEKPPEGLCYSEEGEPVVNDINVGFRDAEDGSTILYVFERVPIGE